MKTKTKKTYRIKPLNNYDIQDLIVKLDIPFFTGVFMRDELLNKKKKRPKMECFILNHGTSKTNGTHWTALAKNNNEAYYFDSYGKLPPPMELVKYLNKNVHLYYNVNCWQKYGTVTCGHLCLKFLRNFWLKNI